MNASRSDSLILMYEENNFRLLVHFNAIWLNSYICQEYRNLVLISLQTILGVTIKLKSMSNLIWTGYNIRVIFLLPGINSILSYLKFQAKN